MQEERKIIGYCKICGEPVFKGTGRRKYCSDEHAAKAKSLTVKKYYSKNRQFNIHQEKVKAELKEIRKKSHLNKDLKDLGKNGEKLGLKSYEYGKYARIKGL